MKYTHIDWRIAYVIKVRNKLKDNKNTNFNIVHDKIHCTAICVFLVFYFVPYFNNLKDPLLDKDDIYHENVE